MFNHLVVRLNAETYWRHNFQQLCHPKQLKKFVVMDVEDIQDHEIPHVVGSALKSHKVCINTDMRSHDFFSMYVYYICWTDTVSTIRCNASYMILIRFSTNSVYLVDVWREDQTHRISQGG